MRRPRSPTLLMRPSRPRGRPYRWCAALLLTMMVAGLTACDDGIPSSRISDGIAPETFVEAFVDLRREGLQSPSGTVEPDEAERILERHDVTPDDLRHFADLHGRNVPLMTSVWEEVERRLRHVTDSLNIIEDSLRIVGPDNG